MFLSSSVKMMTHLFNINYLAIMYWLTLKKSLEFGGQCTKILFFHVFNFDRCDSYAYHIISYKSCVSNSSLLHRRFETTSSSVITYICRLENYCLFPKEIFQIRFSNYFLFCFFFLFELKEAATPVNQTAIVQSMHFVNIIPNRPKMVSVFAKMDT